MLTGETTHTGGRTWIVFLAKIDSVRQWQLKPILTDREHQTENHKLKKCVRVSSLWSGPYWDLTGFQAWGTVSDHF